MDVIPYTIYKGKGRSEGRNLFLFATSKTVSLFGSALFNFAIGLYVLKLTGSPLSFAITLMLGVVPMILIFPFAGVIADKVNKKMLVVTMDFLCGLMLLVVYLVSGWFHLNVILIYISTFLLTVFTTFFAVGLEAAKPNVVSEQRLMSINSISKSIDSLATILGPMLGGLAYGVLDIKLFIVFNSISFFVSGFLILIMDFGFNKTETGLKVKIKVFEDMKDGFRYLAQRKSILQLFILLIAVNFFTGYSITVPLPYIVVEVFEFTAKDLGIIQGSMPIGMLAGALLVKRIMGLFSYQKVLREISNGLALCMLWLGVPLIHEALQFSNIVLIFYYCCIMFFIGFSVALIDIPMAYTMQTEIPDEYRGRVLSIGISIAKVMLPLAVLLSGFLLKCLPAYIMPISGGMLFFLVNLRTFVKNKI